MIPHLITDTTKANCSQCNLYSFCNQPNVSLVSSYKTLKRHELLYSYRGSFDALYAVSKGVLKTIHTDLQGHQHIQQLYFQGEILGFEAIYPNYHPFSAVAITASEICKIPYTPFMKFISSNEQYYPELLSKISQRFNVGLYVNSYSAEQRMACFLLELISRLHVDKLSLEFNLLLSRQDIGDYLGLATETISRVFTRFQQRGILETLHKKIKIIDVIQLQSIAQSE